MMTGTGEASIFSMISRVESTRPPGVLISMRTALSWWAAASSRARAMYSTVTGWMASSREMRRTSAEESLEKMDRKIISTTKGLTTKDTKGHEGKRAGAGHASAFLLRAEN